MQTEEPRRPWTGEEGAWASQHMDKTVIVSILAQLPVYVLPMKLMEIEPLKALSPFCSGGRVMLMQTKAK